MRNAKPGRTAGVVVIAAIALTWLLVDYGLQLLNDRGSGLSALLLLPVAVVSLVTFSVAIFRRVR